MITEIEIWKNIPDHSGYQASNLGRIKSLSKAVNTRNGFRITNERILKLYTKPSRYQSVDLGRGNTRSIHRLVAMSFLDNPKNKPCVNHIDGNPSNNKLQNLEWVTYSENEFHSFRVLGKKVNIPEHVFLKGRKSINSKTVGHFLGNRLIEKFYCVKECAEYFSKHAANIGKHIRVGGVYKNLDLRYLSKTNSPIIWWRDEILSDHLNSII